MRKQNFMFLMAVTGMLMLATPMVMPMFIGVSFLSNTWYVLGMMVIGVTVFSTGFVGLITMSYQRSNWFTSLWRPNVPIVIPVMMLTLLVVAFVGAFTTRP